MPASGAPALSKGDPEALSRAVHHAGPVSLAHQQTLPVVRALQSVVPSLQRGTVVAVRGGAASSLALAVAAGPSLAGSWVGVLGVPALGLVAAFEAGVVLERLLLVAAPPAPEWPTVAGTLIDGVDVVLTTPPRLSMGMARRVQARVRERGGVLVVLGDPGLLEPELTLTAAPGTWEGIHQGAGHLRGRRTIVEANGRRRAARPRRAELWLPGRGGVAVAGPDATVTRLRGARSVLSAASAGDVTRP